MKRFLTVMFAGSLLLLIGISTAQSHSFWAKYKNHPVPDGVHIPDKYLNGDGTLNCCGCHGRIPSIPAAGCNDNDIMGTALCAALPDYEQSICDVDVDIPISIDVAPNVLNLERKGKCVTVHTNIAFSIVDSDSVILSLEDVEVEVEPYSCFADLRGNLVAKFLMSDIVESFSFSICEENTFKLTGKTDEDDVKDFCGTQDILVVNETCERPLP